MISLKAVRKICASGSLTYYSQIDVFRQTGNDRSNFRRFREDSQAQDIAIRLGGNAIESSLLKRNISFNNFVEFP